MNRLPKVTVITVCRNALPLLRHTVENVLQQTYAPLEYLIIDGASTDGTPAYLSSLQAPLQWWSAPDKGIYDAMNKGVARASGEWVIFMNAGDCFAATDVLQRIFSTPRTADVIYGDVLKAAPMARLFYRVHIPLRTLIVCVFAIKVRLPASNVCARRPLTSPIPSQPTLSFSNY